VSPDLNNLSADYRRLLSSQHVKGEGDGNQQGSGYACPDHMGGAPGELFTAGGIVNILRGFLME
jgi:hypothetical protein